MKILDKLYYGKINEYYQNSIKVKDNEKLLETYNKLKLQLNPEQNELFDKYIEMQDNIIEKAYKQKYINGFKTGLLIGIETSKREQ